MPELPRTESASAAAGASGTVAVAIAVAILGGAVGAAIAMRSGLAPGAGVLTAAAFAGFGATTALLVRSDLRERRLPNRLIGLSAALVAIPALCGALLDGRGDRAVAGLLAAAAGFAASWLAWRLGTGLGGGDVKLAPVVLFALGWSSGLERAVDGALAAVLGLLAGTAILLLFSRGRRRELPFGPVLLGAGWTGIALMAFG
ncbi:prepilin peptidase [Leucobacter sp. HNU]|uniref:prepilin peptidase n=1 Tax=Leucobacter sp. HNU TaxID=3236805 RepID=UPI003A7F73D5